MNGPGFSITLLNLSTTASLCSTTTTELLTLLNAETAAPCWPNVKAYTQQQVSRNGHHKADVEQEGAVSENEDFKGKIFLIVLVLGARAICMGINRK